MRFTRFQIRGWKKSLMAAALALVMTASEQAAVMPVWGDEIVFDSEEPAAEDVSGEVLGAEEAFVQDSQNAVKGNLSDLFVESGKDTVKREGETLEEARIGDEPMNGSGDGGSTVNIGHLYVINNVKVRNSDFPSEHYECWKYANKIYAKIWGHNFLNLFNDTENMLRNLPDSELTLTPEHLKAYVSAAPAGAVLRICDEQYLHADDGWGHSQIIISHDENGFTVFEGGLAAFPHRREAYYTWTGYCYSGWPGKYHYIKYIKWPGAETYSVKMVGENATDLGESSLEKAEEKVSDTIQDLLEIAGDVILGKETPAQIRKLKMAICEAAKEVAG